MKLSVSNKVIFLDIDGVLNSDDWNREHQKEIEEGVLIDQNTVKLLAKLVKSSQTQIILHSGWRFWFDDEMTPLREEAAMLAKMLSEEGITLSGKTPDHSTEEIRQTKKYSLVKAGEIFEWLSKHREVEEWLVLDDLDLHNDVVKQHQIMIDPLTGLTEKDIQKAYCMFNKSTYVNDKEYQYFQFLGRGKGGYSYLVEKDGRQYVLKQIHHEPCDYYTFGDKIEAEFNDYHRLKTAGIRIPDMYEIDWENERIIKEYIDGPVIADLVKDGNMKPEYLEQVRRMADQAHQAGLNIDYYPTNFVVQDGLLYYIDYECNTYMDEWSFERWGLSYWKPINL